MDWIKDLDRQTRFLWLYGPAGTGKSAIEQTIAELCDKLNLLAASFFFSRSIGGRNEKTFLITTIVDQLIVSIPEIREHVGNALYNNPSLPTRSLEAQMDALVVKTLEVAASSSTGGVDFMNSRPKVIVLDGLDECGDAESQRYILKVLLNSVSNHSIPFSFILASRPEQHIREAFDGKLLSSLTTRLVLDDKYHPDDDIQTFLQSKFQDIKDRHPSRAHLPSPWPSDEEVERLVQKSSGQFIYASTVIKFIDSHRHWPPDRLDIIFGISPRGKTTPFAEMDSLYYHIFMSASDNIETALEIFAVLLFLHHEDLQVIPSFIEPFLSLREGEVFMVLSDLHSIISVPSLDEQYSPLRLFHASLGDFLTDRSRCGDTFFLDSGVCHRNIVNKMVKQLMNPASGSHLYFHYSTY
jgi:NACHT domain